MTACKRLIALAGLLIVSAGIVSSAPIATTGLRQPSAPIERAVGATLRADLYALPVVVASAADARMRSTGLFARIELPPPAGWATWLCALLGIAFVVKRKVDWQ